jgi:hypothetical protein
MSTVEGKAPMSSLIPVPQESGTAMKSGNSNEEIVIVPVVEVDGQ